MSNLTSCPLCKVGNNCQKDNPTTPCWCTTFVFTEELNEKLARLPLSCICSSCAQKLGAVKKDEDLSTK